MLYQGQELIEQVEEVVTESENEEKEHVDRLLAMLHDLVRLGRRLMPCEVEPQAEGDATGCDQPTAGAARGRVVQQHLSEADTSNYNRLESGLTVAGL